MEIKTANYLVRSFSLDDVNQFFEMAHEEVIKKYVPYAYCESKEEAKESVECYSKGDCVRDFYLAICKDDRIIGAIIAVEMYTGYLDCSLMISKAYRHQGVMKEALNAFSSWLKDNSDRIKAIDLTIEKDNIPSQKLAQSVKADFQSSSERVHYRITIQ